MKTRSILVRIPAVLVFLLVPLAGSAQELTADSGLQFTRQSDRMFLIEDRAGEGLCRLATTAEAQSMRRGNEPVRVIYPAPGQISTAAGLKITLRATAQLEAFPAAKAAFINAAKTWESRIANPLNVTIDVDYGSTLFGTPYPKPEILGATGDSAYNGSYSGLRPLLLARGDSAAETSLYNSLPTGTIPTDLGPATKVGGAYILLRALGVALPDDAPAIGFNSAYAFDLDPANGIEADKFDFEAVAVHEMGHALGFGSAVGATEPMENASSASENIPTIWDLFRFRPGVTSGTFTTAQRPMSSGGTHVSFVGGASLQMSTGRPDNSGGDGQQSSHWKDNTNGNPFIGLMDPTITRGTRGTLTANDMAAFDAMGYSIAVTEVPQVPAAPTNLAATATSATVIRLTWTDNSNNETEFRVEQRVNGSFTDIGSVPANAVAVNVTNFSAGQTGTFRVRARNANGNSGYSNEASATTPGSNPGGPCVANATTVCLLSDRFRVSIGFINQFANPPAPGSFLGAKLVAGVQNPDVATFGISSPQAIEVVVRIQDTRPFGLNRFDVYYGGLTDLEYTVTVTDTQTGTTKTYRNAPGTVGGGVDRTSFTAN